MPSPTTEASTVAVGDFSSPEVSMATANATIKYFSDDDIISGTVVKVDRGEVLLDIGYEAEGATPPKELSVKHDVDPFGVVRVGDETGALVQQKKGGGGRLILPKKRAQYERVWGTIEKIKKEDGIVSDSVIGVVKSGLIADISPRGFLSALLVEVRRIRDLQPYVGTRLKAKIIEPDGNRNSMVLLRHAWPGQTQSEVRQAFLSQPQKGQVRKGTVLSIVNFGASVDLNGVDGLVHASKLSWEHIDHPNEVVEIGAPVTVEMLEVDMDCECVSLLLKATQGDPWQTFARPHQTGQIVPGEITKLAPFGAFARIDDGIKGLMHVSEPAGCYVGIPERIVSVGDEVVVEIIDTDLKRRRVSLSLKQTNEDVDVVIDKFNAPLYGMADSYDERGNYIYPEGFDPKTNEWKPGYEKQQATWEQQCVEAQARQEIHKCQVAEAIKAEHQTAAMASTGYTSTSTEPVEGSPTSDEALQTFREKLTDSS